MTKPFSPFIKWLGIALALAGLTAFVLLTPGDVLRKLDYVGAAVCHRRPSHSFEIADRQLPLCQRCTGTFPGAMTGVLVHWGLWRRRRSLKFPRWPFIALALVFVAIWGLDGINSTTSDSAFYYLTESLIERPYGIGLLGYAPQPWLRLLTGALTGMSMSIILVPAFNQSLWADGEETATLRSGHELATLIAIEVAIVAIIFLLEATQSVISLYAIAIYSSAGVLTMFTLLGAMVFVLLSRHDSDLRGWREAWIPLVWGLVFALILIGVMDGTRLWMNGTIDGVPGLG
jgi:uncharacterized membrane protein